MATTKRKLESLKARVAAIRKVLRTARLNPVERARVTKRLKEICGKMCTLSPSWQFGKPIEGEHPQEIKIHNAIASQFPKMKQAIRKHMAKAVFEAVSDFNAFSLSERDFYASPRDIDRDVAVVRSCLSRLIKNEGTMKILEEFYPDSDLDIEETARTLLDVCENFHEMRRASKSGRREDVKLKQLIKCLAVQWCYMTHKKATDTRAWQFSKIVKIALSECKRNLSEEGLRDLIRRSVG